MIGFFKKKDEKKETKTGLQDDVAELDKIAKMLVRRDLALSEIRETREKELQELKETKKQLEEAKEVLKIKVRARTKELQELANSLDRKVKIKTRELAKALKDVKEEQDKTLAIIDNFSDGLLVFNKKDELSLINPKAEEFLNLDKEKIINRTISDLAILPELSFLKKIKVKPIFRKEFKINSNFILEINSVFVKKGNKRNLTLIILHDITRERRIERMKTEFVSLTAHQLRTPLSAIKWTLKMLLEGDLGKINEEQRDFINKTYNSNERMINLINDLLNVTRIEEGKFILKQSPLSLEELIESLVSSYQHRIKEKKIKFSFRKEEKKIPNVSVDREKIKLAIENLLENALKYTPDRGKIVISVKKENNYIKFRIKDSGVGIPKEQQNRVFTKFFRAANIIRMETEGTGLGLFIAKNIIEAHGGRIWFKSNEGQGTTFYFSLPIKEKSK